MCYVTAALGSSGLCWRFHLVAARLMAKGISAGMASDLYCASTTNIGDTILLKIEETHERQQHLLTQILNALQQDVTWQCQMYILHFDLLIVIGVMLSNCIAQVAPHRHAVQRLSEPVKPTRHSVKKCLWLHLVCLSFGLALGP